MLKRYATLVCVDDKHRVKIGESSCPVAAAERGCQVLIHSNTSSQAADHDFTYFSVIPSVALLVDIPDKISGLWYDGDVHVLYKDSAFEPLSPICHATELYSLLSEKALTESVMFVFSDGGPDHRVTYMSVKLLMICLHVFLQLDLDYLCVARTAPHHSFHNPAERIMSILNLGLQFVGLARASMSEEMEEKITFCNSVSEIRCVAKDNNPLRDSLLDSVAPVKTLLSTITQRLQLKEKKFTVDTAAQLEAISNPWANLHLIDPEFDLQHTDKVSQKSLSPLLKDFISHCCRQQHYFFEIKKCGEDDCTLCTPVRLSKKEFERIKPFPNPMIKDNRYYK